MLLYGLCLGVLLGSSTAEEVNEEVTAKTSLRPASDDPTRDSCTVPEHLDNRVFTKHPCRGSTSCNMSGNTLVPTGELVMISCVPGYNLVQGLSSVVSKVFSACQHGIWDPKPPKCYRMCSPLISETLDFECQQGLNAVRCDKPMLPETTVVYSCKPFYKSSLTSQKNVLTCNANGTWSMELPRCTANCGISNLNSAVLQPTILGGNFSRPGNVPWQTAIYHREDNNWQLRCGGTLISTRHVLTAANCLTSGHPVKYMPRVQDVADVMVAFGKNYRDWDFEEDTEVKTKVKEIIIHPYYVGETINYINDIGVMVLQSDITLNSYVMPACVDFSKGHVDQLRINKTLQGYVAGWGNTEECSPRGQVCDTRNTTLKYVKTTILDFEECFNATQSFKVSQSRLTPDKFCSGNGSESVVQQGDSGGGLTYEFDGLHYIYGVISVKLKLQIKDRFYYNFGAFTNVSYHLDWLISVLD